MFSSDEAYFLLTRYIPKKISGCISGPTFQKMLVSLKQSTVSGFIKTTQHAIYGVERQMYCLKSGEHKAHLFWLNQWPFRVPSIKLVCLGLIYTLFTSGNSAFLNKLIDNSSDSIIFNMDFFYNQFLRRLATVLLLIP